MHSAQRLTYAVVGVGAIGSVIGWRLARAEAPVLLVARGNHLHRIREQGLRLTDDRGSEALPIEACADARGQAPRDVVFIAPKAQDLRAAIESAAPLIGNDTVVIPAVNGLPWWYFKGMQGPQAGPLHSVDPEGRLWSMLEANRIIGAVVHMGASVEEPGHVRQTPHPRLVIGELDRRSSERARTIAAVLTDGGLPTTVVENIRDTVWSKLLGNIATNPLSVLTGATLDRLFNEPELLEIVRVVMAETLAVGAACGVRFEQDLDTRIDIGRRLGAFRTSMLQDFDRGRALELDAISGAVLELADRMRIAMPMTRTVLNLTRAAEHSASMKRNPS